LFLGIAPTAAAWGWPPWERGRGTSPWLVTFRPKLLRRSPAFPGTKVLPPINVIPGTEVIGAAATRRELRGRSKVLDIGRWTWPVLPRWRRPRRRRTKRQLAIHEERTGKPAQRTLQHPRSREELRVYLIVGVLGDDGVKDTSKAGNHQQ
jgi:hypothetical protein